MQPKLVAVRRGHISHIFTACFLLLPQNPSKTSWDSEDRASRGDVWGPRDP